MNKNNNLINYDNAFEVLKEGIRKSNERREDKSDSAVMALAGAYTVLLVHAEHAVKLLAPTPDDIPNDLFMKPGITNQ